MSLQPINDTFMTAQSLSHFQKPSEVTQFPPAGLMTPPLEEGIASKVQDIFNRKDSLEAESDPIIAVIGVGYVGVHLVEAFAHHYRVLAFDINEDRLREVAKGLKQLPIRFTSSVSDLEEAECFLVSVPTLLNHDKTIDIRHLQSAINTVEKHARHGSTVVIESSVAVGMTRKLLEPLATSKNLKVGMSPERVDSGRTFPAFEDIPKVISGIDTASLDSIREIYERVFKNVVSVSSPETAEMVKLYENCQRMVCAAYANEMADACNMLGIDAWEVSQAAASKPFGYQPFRPGPGVGGHCIPVNPYYLFSTCSMPILQHCTERSWRRPAELAKRFMDILQNKKTASVGSLKPQRQRVLVVGVGFKRGQSVLSNSPGLDIIVTLLTDWDVYVEFADPLVPADSLPYVPKLDANQDWNSEYLSTFDGIMVIVDQPGLDMSILNSLQETVVHNYCPKEPALNLTTQLVTSGGAVIRRMSVVGTTA